MRIFIIFMLISSGISFTSCVEKASPRSMIIFRSEVPNRGFFGLEFLSERQSINCEGDPLIIDLGTDKKMMMNCDIFAVPAKEIVFEDENIDYVRMLPMPDLIDKYAEGQLESGEICFTYISRNHQAGRNTIIDIFYHGELGDLVGAVMGTDGSYIDLIE